MFRIDTVDETGFLRFNVEGNQDPQTDVDIDLAIARECIDRDARAALVDIRRLTGRLSMVENHEAARTFQQRMPDSLLRIAIVELPEFGARSEMYEVTARNRGANIRFFGSVTDAEEWLQSGIDERAGT